MRREPRHGLRPAIEGVEVELAVPVGPEEEPPTDPHGVRVVAAAGRLGHLLHGMGRVVEEEDARGRAAAVALPLVEGLREGHVGGRLSIGRDLRLAGVRDREPGREPAPDGHGEQLRVAPRVDLAPRGEQDGLPVGREAEGRVVAGVVREPLRHAARGRHDVDVRVALVPARERDERAVGREPGARLDARVRGQAADAGAVRRRHPQVVRVRERDLAPAGRRVGDEAGVGEVDRPSPGGGKQAESGQGGESMAHHRRDIPPRPPGSSRAGQLQRPVVGPAPA